MDQRARRGIAIAIPAFLSFLVVLSACSDSEKSTPAPAAAKSVNAADASAAVPSESASASETAPVAGVDKAQLAKRGKGVYLSNCIACHSQDPAIEGALGPAIANASFDLIEARVLRAEYPKGYTPKRDSNLMVPMPYLEADLASLTAFLNQ